MPSLLRALLSPVVLGLMWTSAPAFALQNKPVVQLRALDKISARAVTFEAAVDSTVRFGSLYIKPRACRKASPLEAPESTAFLQIWEATDAKDETDQASEWVFSGWMFASSPALSAMDHPIYDVWVLDCLDKAKTTITVESGSVEDSDGITTDDTMPELPDDDVVDQDIDVDSPPDATPSVDP
jgi:hypothetical protein